MLWVWNWARVFYVGHPTVWCVIKLFPPLIPLSLLSSTPNHQNSGPETFGFFLGVSGILVYGAPTAVGPDAAPG
ncbi:hypothetical protein DFH07DRAFT_589806 [Mycena maculata]|uniref:Uncharacterized protein n=1 Tax=Mycena maculata TaxID=230809 RepID=A0AAD7IMV8_9AGAR|nr:hypothetical protein DFH07DRAFT_589806 [Mycena maculata]